MKKSNIVAGITTITLRTNAAGLAFTLKKKGGKYFWTSFNKINCKDNKKQNKESELNN
jgi:hypothetical protein